MEYSDNSLKGSFALPRKKILYLTSISEGAAFGLACVLASLWNVELFPLTKSVFRDLFFGTLWVLIPLAFFVSLLTKKAAHLPFIGPLRRLIVTDIKSLFSESKLFDLCVMSALAGFAEELFFRGVLQVRFGIFASSIIFGLFHCISPAYSVIATAMGFYLGWLFKAYHSLLVPIQVHFLYDLGALICLRYFTLRHNGDYDDKEKQTCLQ